MSDKISIYEIQCALEEIIDAPDNKAVLNGIWRLRNRIAGDHNQHQLLRCGQKYEKLLESHENEKARHHAEYKDLQERYRRAEGRAAGSTKALKEAAEEFTDYVQTQLKGFYAEDIIGKFEDIRSKVIGEINQIK